ncbi:Unknown protein [Striga hermonthica]|uniref:F-box domain-containing protein n=1 Tax=Striga hermonthica TaxID=68872 RepID=A0A9N7RAZ7_STRHE|nr:Unknown protein [Striga hermonthica]
MENKQSATMAPSLIDLPPNIIMEILVRLPLRTLFLSRSVCKTFLTLTSPNPHFIDLHSSNAAQILLIQLGGALNPSHLLNVAEPELDLRSGLYFFPKPLFQLPKMGTSVLYYRTHLREPNNFVLINSCNGLIYLVRRYARDERSLVCNPVTNEYLLIPEVDGELRLKTETKSMWLGFSPGTNQYKVMRVSRSLNNFEFAAQVFVIGSDSWRSIEAVAAPLGAEHSWDLYPTFLNGLTYWLDKSWNGILFFDYEKEIFGDVELPSEFGAEQLRNEQSMSIGVLRGCLCLSFNDFNAQRVDLWVMRKNGNRESWSKDFVVDLVRPVDKPALGRFKPLQVLRSGEIVMLWVETDVICYNPRNKSLKFVGFRWVRSMPIIDVAFTPSFVSLKDTLQVEEVISRHVRLW